MSDKSITEKLQVKGARTLAIIQAPDAFAVTASAPLAAADVVLAFVSHKAELTGRLPEVLAGMRANAIFWLAYPKLTSKLAKDIYCDLNRDYIRALAPEHGLDTVSQIAIDDDWSALRLKRVT